MPRKQVSVTKANAASPKAGPRTAVPGPSDTPGRTLLAVVSLLLVVASPVLVAVITVPRLAATFGTAALSYDSTRASLPEVAGVNGLISIAIFAPMVGFGLGYPPCSGAWRRRLAVTTTVLGLLTLAYLGAAALWVSGAEHPVDRLFSDSGSGEFGALLFVCVVTTAAGAIMTWLSESSDFERRSGEYFRTGRTRAVVAPTPLRVQAVLAACVAAYWVVISVPLLIRCFTYPDDIDDARAVAWGQHDAERAGMNLGTFGVVVGVVLGLLLSVLLLKALYRGPWAGRATGKRPPAGMSLRIAVALRHWPIPLAVVWVLLSPSLLVDASHATADVVSLIVVDVVVAVGLTCVALALMTRVWKVFDPTAPRSRRFRQAPRTTYVT